MKQEIKLFFTRKYVWLIPLLLLLSLILGFEMFVDTDANVDRTSEFTQV